VRTTLRGGWLYTPAKCVVRDLLPPRDLPPVVDPQPNGTLQGTEGHRTHPSPTLVAGCGVDCGLWTRRKVFPHRDVPHFRERWRATFRAVMHRRSKKRVMPTNRSRLPPSPQHFLCQPLTPIPPPPPARSLLLLPRRPRAVALTEVPRLCRDGEPDVGYFAFEW
jgi:hypothetical protein